MISNITKLFGYGGTAEGTVEPEPYADKCELGTCYENGYDWQYHEMKWDRLEGWYYTGRCC